MRTRMGTPPPDPEWSERGRLHEKALRLVAANPGYRDAVDRAMSAFRELIAAKGSATSVERFWEAVAEAAAVARIAVPALAEMVAPVHPGPTLFAKRLIARLAEVDYQRHGDPLAMAIRDELTKMAPYVGIPPRPLEELRESLHEDRKAQRPAGSAILAALTAEELETCILADLAELLRAGRPATLPKIAARRGVSRRTLVNRLTHHGLIWKELKKTAKADDAARRKRP
jgi:hypothetical protein